MDLPDLLIRTHQFALDSFEFYKKLPKTSDAQVPGLQYLKSSTAVNANYRAARRGRSSKEFISKLGNVVEEADESVEWLEVMRGARIADNPKLLSEARQLCAIFTASLKTARKNEEKREQERKKKQKGKERRVGESKRLKVETRKYFPVLTFQFLPAA
jgi:four helix bundle protein